MIRYMTCTTCKGVVQVNNTGICLRCQGGFTQTLQGDEFGYVAPESERNVPKEEGNVPRSERNVPRHKPTKKAKK